MFFWQQHPQAAQLQDAGGAGNDVCAAAGFAVGSPVIGAPAVNQNHALAGAGFAVGSPVIGAAALFGNTALTAAGFAVASPVIGAAALAGAVVDPGIPAGDIGGGRGGARNRDAASRWLEIERARLRREKARRRSAEKAIADALKDPPKSAEGAAVAVVDLSDGARVTLAALLDGMAPQTAAVVADQVDALLSASQDAAKPRREIEAAREWIAEVQAVLDEQARIQAEDDEVLLLLLAA